MNDGLATKVNKWRRKLVTDWRCEICGARDENGFPVVVSCNHAQAVRTVWTLPADGRFRNTCPFF